MYRDSAEINLFGFKSTGQTKAEGVASRKYLVKDASRTGFQIRGALVVLCPYCPRSCEGEGVLSGSEVNVTNTTPRGVQ